MLRVCVRRRRLWKRTNACYHQLMSECRHNVLALHDLETHNARYHVYSIFCTADPDKQQCQSPKYLTAADR